MKTPFIGAQLFSYFCLLQRKSNSLLNARGNANFLLASLSKVAIVLAGTGLWSL